MSNFSAEYWKNIPFGKKLDQFGGSRIPMKNPELRQFYVEEDTSRGRIELRFVEGRFNVLAVDLGIGLLYDKDGKLETIGIDLLAYCMNLDKEDVNDEDGVLLMEMLGRMVDNNDRLYIGIELKDKTLAFANLNETTGEREVISYSEEINYSLKNLARVNYNGNNLLFGLCNNDDEFIFGVRAGDKKTPDNKINTNMLVTRILSDCNYRTFLESKSEDRWERLAKRIFM